MNKKNWKVWLFPAICFLFIGIMKFTDKNYLMGSAFVAIGLAYISICINYYKKDKRDNENKNLTKESEDKYRN